MTSSERAAVIAEMYRLLEEAESHLIGICNEKKTLCDVRVFHIELDRWLDRNQHTVSALIEAVGCSDG